MAIGCDLGTPAQSETEVIWNEAGLTTFWNVLTSFSFPSFLPFFFSLPSSLPSSRPPSFLHPFLQVIASQLHLCFYISSMPLTIPNKETLTVPLNFSLQSQQLVTKNVGTGRNQL